MKQSNQKIKIGFAALGDHALQSHLKHIAGYEDVEIIGAFDPNPVGFERAAKECGIQLKAFQSYEEMLARADGVIICSPDRFHTAQLTMAAEMGVHAFCEKPLCRNEEEYQTLKRVFESAETIISSCHPRRFDPPYVWVKENLPALCKDFGKVMNVDLDFTYHKPSSEKRDLHGDSMLQDHANHEIDYVNFLFGVRSMTAYKLIDEHDRYELAGARDDGIVFRFQGTRRLDSRTFSESIRIRFERGGLHVDTYKPQLSYVERHEHPAGAERVNHTATDYDYRFDCINRNFIDAIRTGKGNYLKREEMLLNSQMSIAFKNSNVFNYVRGAKVRE